MDIHYELVLWFVWAFGGVCRYIAGVMIRIEKWVLR